MSHPEPLLVQAPVKALDEDGIGVALVGTIAFVVAVIVLVLNGAWLAQAGHQWWLWVAISGAGIGVAFLAYCLIRKSRRTR